MEFSLTANLEPLKQARAPALQQYRVNSSKQYAGSCHCGAVRFRANLDLGNSIVCDCSVCVKKGTIANRIADDDFELLTSLDDMGIYRFNKKIAKHYFCKTCGIHPFHRPRSYPELWAVNVRCLEGVDVDKISPRQVHGSKLD